MVCTNKLKTYLAGHAGIDHKEDHKIVVDEAMRPFVMGAVATIVRSDQHRQHQRSNARGNEFAVKVRREEATNGEEAKHVEAKERERCDEVREGRGIPQARLADDAGHYLYERNHYFEFLDNKARCECVPIRMGVSRLLVREFATVEHVGQTCHGGNDR